MQQLNLGKSSDRPFTLPIELATQSIAILAKRGVGKTYTAAVFAEEFHRSQYPPNPGAYQPWSGDSRIR